MINESVGEVEIFIERVPPENETHLILRELRSLFRNIDIVDVVTDIVRCLDASEVNRNLLRGVDVDRRLCIYELYVLVKERNKATWYYIGDVYMIDDKKLIVKLNCKVKREPYWYLF